MVALVARDEMDNDAPEQRWSSPHDSEIVLGNILIEVLKEQQQCRAYLQRLVELEEERREGERELEAFSRAFMPAAQAATDVVSLDHFRNRDGSFGIHESDGSTRDATSAEAAQLRMLTGTGRRKRGF